MKIAGKATVAQQVIQTTILISILPWQGTFMQKREEAEMSSGARNFSSAFMNPLPFSSGSPSCLTQRLKGLILPLSRKIFDTNILYLLKLQKDPLFDRTVDNRSNQKNGEEFKSTYLPLHRPLHAASVRSKSRTDFISDRTEQPVPVLS